MAIMTTLAKNLSMHQNTKVAGFSLVPRPHPQKEERVWHTSSTFWGAQDAACHVIVMTTHRLGMATHHRLSHAAIGG